MSSAFSAQRLVRAALGVTLGLAAGCGSFQFGKHPSLPGAGGGASTYNPDTGPTPSFSGTERERIALAQPWVDAAAYDYELEPQLINAVIWVESRFNPKATSPAGAQGMMQLMPPTAKELAQKLGKRRPSSYDPEFNITAGSLYLRKMLNKYDGDVELALAAYNAGPGNVDKWTRDGGSLPPRSIEYVTLVLDAKRRFEEHHESILTQTDTMLAQAEVEPAPVREAPPTRYVPDPPRSQPKPAPRATPKPEPKAEPEPVEPPRPSEAPASGGQAPPKAVGKGVLPSVLD
ncbi:MAG: lytic transglycosylase domain-containing protein [Myxococcota bacterium]